MNESGNKLKGSIALLIASVIWGFAFVSQKLGMEFMDPISFNGIRSVLGSLFLLPIILIISRYRYKKAPEVKKSDSDKGAKMLIIGGLICGFCLFAAANLQQVGLLYTSAGKAGFITSLYIVLVPIFSLFFGKRIRPVFIIFLAMAVFGLYLLCISGDFSLSVGDGLVLICAFVFAVQILAIDYFVRFVDPIKLSCAQLFVSGVLSIIVSLFTETITIDGIINALPAILFTGICSSGIAYTLQIVGQKRVNAAVASLIMSLESVFAVIGGAMFMGETMSVREVIGCVIMFAAIILSQVLPISRTKTE